MCTRFWPFASSVCLSWASRGVCAFDLILACTGYYTRFWFVVVALKKTSTSSSSAVVLGVARQMYRQLRGSVLSLSRAEGSRRRRDPVLQLALWSAALDNRPSAPIIDLLNFKEGQHLRTSRRSECTGGNVFDWFDGCGFFVVKKRIFHT